jgi:hypothetical protein
MTIQKIIGENGAMPQLCRGGACPAAVLTENDVFVQGFTPAPTEGAALAAPLGEGFVRMPRAVFEKIARQVLAS